MNYNDIQDIIENCPDLPLFENNNDLSETKWSNFSITEKILLIIALILVIVVFVGAILSIIYPWGF